MKKNARAQRTFCLALLAALLSCALLTAIYMRNRMRLEYAQMEQLISSKTSKVESVLTKLLYKTQVLSALAVRDDGSIVDFERVARTVIDDPSIRNVLLAPDGVVRCVYPLAGNESVLGLDFTTDSPGNIEAVKAVESGTLVLGGPFELKQGGMALVGRLPIYIGGEYWGLCSVTLNYPQALEAADLGDLAIQGMAYEIWRVNPDDGERQAIAQSDYEYSGGARYIEKKMSLLNTEWYFRLSPVRAWYAYAEAWLFAVASLVVSALIALLAKHNLELNEAKSELEKQCVTDALTGVLNRRGLSEAVAAMGGGKSAPTYSLSFVDFDGFKRVNDTYGHLAGDQLLCGFARIVQARMGENCRLARLGGDEFLLIEFGQCARDVRDSFWEDIRKRCKAAAVAAHGREMEAAFSVGFAASPSDGTDLDEVIRAADRNMYESKKRSK